VSIYISRNVRRYKSCPSHQGDVFYLAGDDPHQAEEFVFRHRLDEHAGICGTAPRLYYELPLWLRSVVLSHDVEQVTLAEFDRRTCAGRGGIPTVQLGLSFSDEVTS
jgi:hypothetical protein